MKNNAPFHGFASKLFPDYLSSHKHSRLFVKFFHYTTILIQSFAVL